MKRYRPNPAFARQMRDDPGVRAAAVDAAREAKRRCEQIAPRGGRGRGYADRFRVLVDEHGRVLLTNYDFAAHLVEWGSANNVPYAVLRRGVRAVGLELREDDRA